MRQRLAALALLLLPLSACSYTRSLGYGPDPERYSDADADLVPMRARLYSDYTGLRVYTNRPAYVAIFEISPGSGASLLYPAYRSERGYMGAGSNRIVLTSPRPGYFYYNADYSGTSGAQPRHYLLIASRHPLNVGEIQDEPVTLRRRLGYTAFAGINARQVMNELADMVLPAENDEDWDSDVLTVWPEYRTRLADYNGGGYWTGVRCYDGYEETVPLEWLPYACYDRERGYYDHGRRQGPPPPAPHDTAHHQPSDTGTVTVPGHRRPEPPPIPAEGVGQRLAGGRPSIDPSPVFRPGLPDDRPRVEPGAATTSADEPARRPREPRLEPRRFQPRDEPGSAGGESAPRVASPRTERPRSEPQPSADEPRRVQPAREQPRDATPRVETRREEPRAEPRHEEPRHEEPRQEQPRQPEQRREEPRRESPPPQPQREQPQSAPAERYEPRSQPAPQAPAVSRPEESKKPPQA